MKIESKYIKRNIDPYGSVKLDMFSNSKVKKYKKGRRSIKKIVIDPNESVELDRFDNNIKKKYRRRKIKDTNSFSSLELDMFDHSKIIEEYKYDIDNHFHKLLGFYINNDEYIIKKFSMIKQNKNVERFSLKIIFEDEYEIKENEKMIKEIVKLYILKNYVHINNYNKNLYSLIESENSIILNNKNFYSLIEIKNNIILNNKNINNYEYTILLSNKTKINILKGGACDSINNNRKTINFMTTPIYSEPLVEQYSHIIKSLLRPTVDPRSFDLSYYTHDQINAVKPNSLIRFKNYILTIISDVSYTSKLFGIDDVNLRYVYGIFGNYKKWSNYLVLTHLENHKYVHNGIDDIHLINSFIPNSLNDFEKSKYLVFYHSFLHLLDENYMYNKNSLISRNNIKEIQSCINAFRDRRFSACVYRNLQLNRGKFLKEISHYNYLLPYSIKDNAINDKLRHYRENFINDNNNIVPEYKDQFNHIIYPSIYPPIITGSSGTNILINDDLLNTLAYSYTRSDNRIIL